MNAKIIRTLGVALTFAFSAAGLSQSAFAQQKEEDAEKAAQTAKKPEAAAEEKAAEAAAKPAKKAKVKAAQNDDPS